MSNPIPASAATALNRRRFLCSSTVAAAGAWAIPLAVLNRQHVWAAEANHGTSGGKRVVVGGHPWVYAAPLPNYDITPVLPTIFEDMSYAGLDGIELMHTALRSKDAVSDVFRQLASFASQPLPQPGLRPFRCQNRIRSRREACCCVGVNTCVNGFDPATACFRILSYCQEESQRDVFAAAESKFPMESRPED